VYLLYFLTAFFATFAAKGIVVPTDAAATANGILAHESLYRSAFAVGFIANLIYIAVTALFYKLFCPVNWSVSLIAAFFSLVGCAIQIFSGLLQLAPFLVLKNSHLLNVFKFEQLQSLALLSLTLYGQTFNISLIIFRVYDLLIGYLISRSTFMPRILGGLMICAGVGWRICVAAACNCIGLLYPGSRRFSGDRLNALAHSKRRKSFEVARKSACCIFLLRMISPQF